LALGALLLGLVPGTSVQAQSYTKPKVRAITAFVRLDRSTYSMQIAKALTVLRSAQQAFEQQGYDVQTLRIVTQPLAELVGRQSEAAALAFLRALDELSAKNHFVLDVGPAMLRDTDDPAVMRLLARAITTLDIQGSAIVAGEDGIHWKVIAESARLVRYVTDHTAHSEGNFRFTATAMLAPYGPFYPGAYHTGEGKRFSIGFQGANIVQEVFARTRGDFSASVCGLRPGLADQCSWYGCGFAELCPA
jgi:uncharacterized protein (UPF0210 family)